MNRFDWFPPTRPKAAMVDLANQPPLKLRRSAIASATAEARENPERATAGVRFVLGLAVFLSGCSGPAEQPAAAPASPKPADAQHAGITTPHGDHTAHHGGMVLMSGDLHYEVVFDRNGKHHVWFSDAVRADLPASVATNVVMIVTRKNAPPEQLALAIDESGESWVASGQPVAGDDVMVKVAYAVKGAPFEIEIPFLIPVK